MSQAKRMQWIDTTRGLAIISVLVFHSGTLLRFGYQTPSLVVLLGDILDPFRMQTLSFLSGYVVFLSKRKGEYEYIVNKVYALLWPYAIWTVIYSLTAGRAYSFIDHEMYISYLWYIGYVFIYYISYIILYKVHKVLIIVLCTTVAALIPPDIEAAQRFFTLAAYFYFGILAQEMNIIKKLNDKSVVIGAISALSVMTIAVLGHYRLFDYAKYDPVWVPATSVAVLFICGLVLRYHHAVSSDILTIVGQNSLVFYTTHFPLIYLLTKAWRAMSIENVYIAYILNIVSSIAICFAINIAKDKVYPIRWFYEFPFKKHANSVLLRIGFG